jgi:hypothetical protein
MSSILFINKLSKEEWSAVVQDSRFDKNYRTIANNQEELAHNLIDRVKQICTQLNRVPPNKITVTDKLKSSVELSDGELRIHPMTFAACKLNRSQLSIEHKELYKELENYIADVDALINQNKSLVEDSKPQCLKSLEYELAAKKLLLQHKPNLEGNLNKYEHIIPSIELDSDIRELMKNSCDFVALKAARSKIEALVKIISVSSLILSFIPLEKVVKNHTPENLYWPLIGCIGLLIATGSWERWKTSERVDHLLAQFIYPEPLAERASSKSWIQLSPEEQISNSKYEFFRGSPLTTYA